MPGGVSGTITFIYSQSTDESRRFYAEGLGLPVRSDKGAVVFYALPGDAASLGVVRQGLSAASTPPCSAKAAGRDTVMLCLLTESVDTVLRRAGALGHSVQVVQEPRINQAFGIYNALLRDPDGYLVELQQFLDADEHRRFTVGA